MAQAQVVPSGNSRIVRQSYADQVYHHIKELILSGTLRQGEKIVEDKIAKQLGVSRTPIREALTRLQVYGLVHLQPRSYAEVVTLNERQASDIAQVRLHLERMAFSLLCERQCEPAMMRALEQPAQQAREALERGDKAGYFEADSAFHVAAVVACGNGELATIYQRFESRVQLLRIAQDVSIERLEVYMNQHFDLLDLLSEGRVEAINALLDIHIVHDLT